MHTGLSACCMNGVSVPHPCCTSSTWGGAPGTSEPGSPSLSLLQLQTYSFLFLSSLPAGSLTSLSASLGTQCHCSGPPGLSLGSSWDRLRAQALGSRQRGQRAHGQWCRSRELGGGCAWGRTQPEALELRPRGATLSPQSEPCCWGRAASTQLRGQSHGRAPPPLAGQPWGSHPGRRWGAAF